MLLSLIDTLRERDLEGVGCCTTHVTIPEQQHVMLHMMLQQLPNHLSFCASRSLDSLPVSGVTVRAAMC